MVLRLLRQSLTVGVAPVKSPNIMYAQTPFNFRGCPRYILISYIQIFTKKIHPEVHQQRILRILLVTGLVTHI